MEVATSQKINNCGLFWCIVFFIVVRTSVLAFNCNEVNECMCNPNKCGTFYDIICKSQDDSSFRIHIYFKELIQISCVNSPKWEDFHVNLRPSENNYVKFKDCDLPPSTTSLSEIMQILGVTNLKSLLFTHSTTLNDELIKHYQHGTDNLKELTLCDNMTSCHRGMLANLPNLTLLSLAYNYLRIIPAGLFKHTAKLETLKLNGNNLKSIESGTFDNLKFLKLLSISDNKLIEFPSATYGQLAALEILYLNDNDLTNLPENIFAKMENLTYIGLGSNYFAELPRHLLRNNTKLQTFDISFNPVRVLTLPREFFSNLTDLKELILNWTSIATLSEDIFWGSFSLAKINLSINRLKFLPQNIFRDAKQLISLDISKNELEELPENIFNNTNRLEKLDISNKPD